MIYDVTPAFSWWINSSSGRNNRRASRAAVRADWRAGHRVLRLEQLEHRQLLSIGLGLGVGNSPAAQAPGSAGQNAVPAAVAAVNPGPTIDNVIVAPTPGVISWNVADSVAVTCTSLAIDGTAVSNLCGPYTADSGLAYAWAIGTLSTGSHTYVITASDSDGNSSQSSGTLTVEGPTINSAVASPAQGVISWNVVDPVKVACYSVTVDGAVAPNLYGPYASSSGLNYAAAYGPLGSGTHAYVITVSDAAGNWSQEAGSFTVSGPTINYVVTAVGQGTITWNVAAPAGVACVSLAVDGAAVSHLCGPYNVASGSAYSWPISALSTGSHSYVITASDNAGNWSQYAGSFTVAGPTISNVAASVAQGMVTWNVAAPAGVACAAFAIDGAAVSNLYGPYSVASGSAYAWPISALSTGSHSYVITVSDNAGNWSEFGGSFTVAGPTIGNVVASVAQGMITWTASAADGVACSSLVVDGTAVSNLYGPYSVAAGLAYSWGIGAFFPAATPM